MNEALLKYVVFSSASLLTTSKIIENKRLDEDAEILPPPDKVSIIIPSLDEEPFIEQCLLSLRNQSVVNNYPEYFEYILVDNGSTDNTISIAERYVDKVLISPRGKLNARNLGTLNSNGNIIVSVDSDIKFPYHYLNTLLKPLNNPSISGVSGSVIDYSTVYPFVPAPFITIGTALDRTINKPYRMMGGNCAYWKHLFYLIGQFNTNINQFNGKEMIQEEELGFGRKLSKYGKVLYKHNAYGIHLGGERTSCRIGFKSKDLCSKYKIGIERFG